MVTLTFLIGMREKYSNWTFDENSVFGAQRVFAYFARTHVKFCTQMSSVRWRCSVIITARLQMTQWWLLDDRHLPASAWSSIQEHLLVLSCLWKYYQRTILSCSHILCVLSCQYFVPPALAGWFKDENHIIQGKEGSTWSEPQNPLLVLFPKSRQPLSPDHYLQKLIKKWHCKKSGSHFPSTNKGPTCAKNYLKRLP